MWISEKSEREAKKVRKQRKASERIKAGREKFGFRILFLSTSFSLPSPHAVFLQFFSIRFPTVLEPRIGYNRRCDTLRG